MTRPTRIALYFAGYSGKIIGAGLLVMGLAYAAHGAAIWNAVRKEGQEG